MIPIITGVIASSIAVGGIFSFNGQGDCLASSPVTVYTTSPILAYGVTLYENVELTLPYNGLFIMSGVVYVVSDGNITIIAAEFTTGKYSTYDGCFGETPSGNIWIPSNNTSVGGAVYTACYADDSTKAINQTYNIDNSGNNLIANVTISTDGSGVINSNIPCE